MANTVTPNQEITIDPNSDIFDSNVVLSRAYHSYIVNRLNRVMGQNIIDDGMEIVSPVINSSGLVSLKVNPGSCIISSNYVNVTSTTTLTLSVADYTFNGGIIVHGQFSSQDSINSEKLVLRMNVQGPSPDYLTYPGPWIFNKDTLIFGYLTFSKNPYSLVNLTPSIGANSYYITIAGTQYEVRPTGNILSGISERTTPVYEKFTITTQVITNGYLELESAPVSMKFLELSIADSGMKLVSKNVVDDISIPDYTYVVDGVTNTKHPADYQLVGRRIYIRNSIANGITNLSEDISADMVLIARYLHG